MHRSGRFHQIAALSSKPTDSQCLLIAGCTWLILNTNIMRVMGTVHSLAAPLSIRPLRAKRWQIVALISLLFRVWCCLSATCITGSPSYSLGTRASLGSFGAVLLAANKPIACYSYYQTRLPFFLRGCRVAAVRSAGTRRLLQNATRLSSSWYFSSADCSTEALDTKPGMPVYGLAHAIGTPHLCEPPSNPF